MAHSTFLVQVTCGVGFPLTWHSKVILSPFLTTITPLGGLDATEAGTEGIKHYFFYFCLKFARIYLKFLNDVWWRPALSVWKPVVDKYDKEHKLILQIVKILFQEACLITWHTYSPASVCFRLSTVRVVNPPSISTCILLYKYFFYNYKFAEPYELIPIFELKNSTTI